MIKLEIMDKKKMIKVEIITKKRDEKGENNE